MSPLSNAENENQIENGSADDKQPLKNGGNEKVHMVEAADPDEAARPEEGPLRSMFSSKYKNRKYKMYDNGKRSSSGLSPLKSSSRFRIEQKIKERTGLTRTGLVFLVLCVLLTIALLVCAILWPRTAQSRHHSTCIKPSCFRSSAEILPKLNTSGVPCNDFRNYACGNWFSSKPLPKSRTEWNLKEQLQFSYRRKIHELLVTKYVTEVSSEMALSWKLKYFLDSCMNIDPINVEKERPLKNIIAMFGGWDALRGNFKRNQWDTYRTIKRLHAEYNVSPFFQIDVVPDIVNKNQNIVQLKPPLLGLPNRSYYLLSRTSPVIVSYLNFIKDVVQLFGATSTDAHTFSEDLFYHEKRIAETFTTVPSNATSSYARMKVSKLTEDFAPIKFYEILIGTLQNANLNTDSYVLIEDMEYFQKLPTLLSQSDIASLNRYMLWRLVADYLPYLSKEYLDALWTFRSAFLGQAEPMPRWEFCIATLQRFTGFGLMVLFQNNTIEREPIISMITEVFSETSTAIKKDIFWKIKNSETLAALTDKIDTIGIQIGLPVNMTKPEYLDDNYLQFNPVQSDFFNNILSGHASRRETLQKRLKNPQEEYKWLNDMTSQPVTVSYNAAAHKIIVPPAVLQAPYFEKDYPQTALYAGLGREIASAFVSGLLPNKHHSNQTKRDTKDYMDLLGKCVLQADTALRNVPDKETFIVTLGGLKYAYQSLSSKLSMSELSSQPAMEAFENANSYFISYAQSMCSVKTHEKETNDISFSNALNDTQLINSVLEQLPEFTNKYSCGSISKSDGSLCNI